MPIAAIAIAVIADVGAAGAVSAAVAGTITISSALEITAALGATLGAIGAVTHDKTLSTVGMIMGGVGGLGQLAVNAGMFGANAGSTVLFGSSGSATGATSAAGGVAGGVAETPQQGVVDSLGTVDNGASPTTATAIATGTPPDMQPGWSVTGESGNTGGLINNASDAAKAVGSVGMGSAVPSATSAAVSTAPTSFLGKITSGAFWGKMFDDPLTRSGMIQAGGAFLSGMTDQTKDLQAKMMKLQLANMQSPIPVASRLTAMPVTGAPSGIINAPAAGTVTGAPIQ